MQTEDKDLRVQRVPQVLKVMLEIPEALSLVLLVVNVRLDLLVLVAVLFFTIQKRDSLWQVLRVEALAIILNQQT